MPGSLGQPLGIKPRNNDRNCKYMYIYIYICVHYVWGSRQSCFFQWLPRPPGSRSQRLVWMFYHARQHPACAHCYAPFVHPAPSVQVPEMKTNSCFFWRGWWGVKNMRAGWPPYRTKPKHTFWAMNQTRLSTKSRAWPFWSALWRLSCRLSLALGRLGLRLALKTLHGFASAFVVGDGFGQDLRLLG